MSTIVIQQRRSDRTTSAIITTVLHVLLGILFLFIGMKQFDPPIPEQMVELVMEDSGGDAGGGASQPETGGQPTTAEESGEPEDVATDEESDVEVIKPPVTKPVTKPVPKPVVKQPKKDTRLEDALNNWNTPSETLARTLLTTRATTHRTATVAGSSEVAAGNCADQEAPAEAEVVGDLHADRISPKDRHCKTPPGSR